MTTLYQFTRVTNCFYVVNAILQFIPSINTNDPMATVIPLAFVVVVGILKELVVEIRRWQQDREVNSMATRRLDPSGKMQKITLNDVKVGDVLKIMEGETLPADCILLRTKKECNGMCFV
jgi:P-type E1-E2 ATPase